MTYTGFHAVEERIRRAISEHKTSSLSVQFANPGPRVKKIIALAKENNISCTQVSDTDLDKLTQQLPVQSRDHRGIVLIVSGEEAKATNAVSLEQWLSVPREKACVLILDSVTDPHNVGAILRSCDQLGADLCILSERRSASDVQHNETIARSSAGASAYVPCATVTNLVRAAEQLKKAGFWLYAADARGTSVNKTSFADKTCIIMGSEGSGISRLLAEQCDTFIAIPTCGKIDSLNVSVAAGILLYEVRRQSL